MSERRFVVDKSGTGSLGSVTEDWATVLPPGCSFYWRMKPPVTNVKHVEESIPPEKKEGKKKRGNVDTTGETPPVVKSASGSDAGQELSDDTLKTKIISTNQRTPPPRLEPLNEPYSSYQAYNPVSMDIQDHPSTHVNIRDEHHWTESPMTSRTEVPVLSLKEYNVLQNAAVNQIIQNIGVTVQATNDAGSMLGDIFGGLTEEGGMQKAATKIKAAIKDFETTQGSVRSIPDEVMGSADPMLVYESLYSRHPTGFKYSLPYMENLQFQTKGGYTDEINASGFMGMIKDYSEFAAKFSGVFAGRFLEPGRYIEKPKNYAFDSRQKSYTITFPLFNTKSYAEIIKNWQFLFLITYQNTPGRITKDVIQPPVQYEAYIPGSWYCKYASITDMTVNFRGARREMNIPIPFLDRATGPGGGDWLLQKRLIRTIIPDAYEVSITLTEIFGESQNTLYHMLAQSSDTKIQVGSLSPTNTSPVSKAVGGARPNGKLPWGQSSE